MMKRQHEGFLGGSRWCWTLAKVLKIVIAGAKHATRKKLSSPAHAGDPARRGFSVRSPTSLEYWVTRWSLSSGGHSPDPVAGDDNWVCGYVLATHFARGFQNRFAP
jgi:hypothetical protein